MRTDWTPTAERLPPDETPVLVYRKGKITVAERRWEHPTFEETFESFWFWACPDENWIDDDGMATVSHWMPLPAVPSA